MHFFLSKDGIGIDFSKILMRIYLQQSSIKKEIVHISIVRTIRKKQSEKNTKDVSKNKNIIRTNRNNRNNHNNVQNT